MTSSRQISRELFTRKRHAVGALPVIAPRNLFEPFEFHGKYDSETYASPLLKLSAKGNAMTLQIDWKPSPQTNLFDNFGIDDLKQFLDLSVQSKSKAPLIAKEHYIAASPYFSIELALKQDLNGYELSFYRCDKLGVRQVKPRECVIELGILEVIKLIKHVDLIDGKNN